MSHTTQTTRTIMRRCLLATAGTAATLMLVAGCSSDAEEAGDSTTHSPASTNDDLDEVQDQYDVPEECREMMAFDQADISDVTLLPDGWPDAPVEATLCKAESTMDGSSGMLSYATEVAPEQVIAAYEEALGDQVEVSDHVGQIVGHADDVQFSVSAGEGRVVVAFAKS